MGCFGDREQYGSATNEQTWDYLNLSDFKSTSCWSPFSYGIVYILLVISVAVYIVDIYTASNLLFFDRWSSQVKPWIPFEVSRWVFAGCIILSWILLAYRMWRAIRAMRTGVITASYLDPLAVRIESVRPGKARGWRRFLVFAALTKGRKGSEYIALFTYFSFEAWLRIVFAEGPRQVINALTLYSVLKAKLIPVGQHAPNEGHTSVAQFFINVKILANDNTQQATILFGMLYVLIVWIFSAISLIVAFLMYITFLWHHIPSADGSLTQFCRRKIEKRLNQIVRKKVDKAIAKDYKDRVNRVATGGVGASVGAPASNLDLDYKRQPTLPNLDASAEVPPAPLSRQTTGNNYNPFESRPASPFGFRPASPFMERPSSPRPSALSGSTKYGPTIPDLDGSSKRPEAPSRHGTQSSLHSDTSYASDAPLMGGAAEMGYRLPNRQSPPGGPSRIESERSASSSQGPPPRNYSAMSQNTQRSASAGQSRTGLPPRQSSATSSRSMAPSSGSTQGPGRHPMSRDPSAASTSSQQRRPLPGPSSLSRRPTQEYEMQSPTSSSVKPPPLPSAHGSTYLPFRPTVAGQPRNFAHPQQHRPAPPPTDYFGETQVPQRVGTAPAAQSAGMYDDTIYDAYGASNPPPGQQAFVPFRSATAGPGPRPGPPTGPMNERRMNSNDAMRAAQSPYRPPNF